METPPPCGCGVCRADRAIANTARALIAMLAIVILIFATAGTVKAGEPPFGNDGPPCHGQNQNDCRPDPQPSHGQDCDAHGNNPDGNDDHCGVDQIEEMPGPSATPLPTPSPTEDIGEPASTENPDPAVVVPPEQRPLSPVAYPDGAGQPPLPDTAMNPGWSDSQKVLYVIGSILFIIGLRITLRALFQRR